MVSKMNIQALLRNIAGEISLAENPGRVMRKWREQFNVSQNVLAEYLGISPSVVSDYESGRRKSPRVDTIRKFAESLIAIDERRGGHIVRAFIRLLDEEIPSDVLLDTREFLVPILSKQFIDFLDCEVVVEDSLPSREIYGYTAIDSLRAILQLSPEQMLRLYGATPHRAAIFTNVSTGRSPMVAIRTSQMGLGTAVRPSIVILHGLKEVDEVARKIAEMEKIPLFLLKIEDIDVLIKTLRRFQVEM